jgi:hypothetical protein
MNVLTDIVYIIYKSDANKLKLIITNVILFLKELNGRLIRNDMESLSFILYFIYYLIKMLLLIDETNAKELCRFSIEISSNLLKYYQEMIKNKRSNPLNFDSTKSILKQCIHKCSLIKNDDSFVNYKYLLNQNLSSLLIKV